MPLQNLIEIRLRRYIKFKKKYNLPKCNFEKEIPKIKKYVKLLKENYYKDDINYSYVPNPKISFIASVYNKEKYLSSFILSIKFQYLKEFELILVDDTSTDKSIEKINEFLNRDKRIKLIKNKKNMGSLYASYIGAIQAKGKYIIFVDSDDIILKEGIFKAYNHITKKKLDMIEFHPVFESHNKTYINRRYYIYKDIIYQPLLSYIYYYNNSEGIELNAALWNKLIKRETVLTSFYYIGQNFINKRIIIENDVIILFSLFRNSKSYQYIDELGYYYFDENNNSITKTRFEQKKSNQVIYSIFMNIKFLYEKTGNSYLDKYLSIFKLEQGYDRYKQCFKYLNKNFDLIEKVLNKLINSKYVSLEKKLIIKNINKEIFNNCSIRHIN